MEIIEPSKSPKQHFWLKWAGLQEPPLDADSWVPVVRGLHISDRKTQSSSIGDRFVARLIDAGVEAEQRVYVTYDMPADPVPTSLSGGATTRVAVIVHRRDEDVARRIATQMAQTLEHERQEREKRLPLVPEQELEREALDAGDPPET